MSRVFFLSCFSRSSCDGPFCSLQCCANVKSAIKCNTAAPAAKLYRVSETEWRNNLLRNNVSFASFSLSCSFCVYFIFEFITFPFNGSAYCVHSNHSGALKRAFQQIRRKFLTVADEIDWTQRNRTILVERLVNIMVA